MALVSPPRLRVRTRAAVLAELSWSEGLRTAVASALLRTLACYAVLTSAAVMSTLGSTPAVTVPAGRACSSPCVVVPAVPEPAPDWH